jgi:hypothetical protein
MNQPRPEMACATCLTPLNTLGDTYIHPLGSPASPQHRPVPVPVSNLDTVRRTCDFCGDPHPIWTITGGDLTAVITSTTAARGLVQNFGDRWATCAPCYQHIASRQFDRLADRALRTLPSLDPDTQNKIAVLHQGFLAGLQPGRTLITTTAWPTTMVSARDLPKIRDRLNRFYRSPISLPHHLGIHREDLADQLEQGRLYWVDPTFTDLAATAAQSLHATVLHSDLVPGDTGILAWATPMGDAAAITWTLHDTTVRLVRYRNIGGGLDDATLQTVREDIGWLAPMATHTLSLDTKIDPQRQPGTAIALATWLLMGQRATETPTVETDKQTRRRYARDKRPLPDVRLVRLRAAGQPPSSTPCSLNSVDRTATSERVWVTGHWRDQPYGPGRALRRPVYIHPFLRGPDDAPIKLSTTVRVLAQPKQKPTS